MIRKLLFLSLFFILSSVFSYGQGTMGKDFWVAYLEPDTGVAPARPPSPPTFIKVWDDDSIELYLTSPFYAKVTIEAKSDTNNAWRGWGGLTSDYSQTINLKPNKTVYLKLPNVLAVHYHFSDEITINGVHIFSDTLISVQAVTRFQGTKGATTVIPTSSIPFSPEYFIITNASYDTRWQYNGNDAQSTQFAIVGISELSEIEIITTGLPLSRRYYKKGDAFVIKLKKGETFGFASTDLDLTGSIIRSKSSDSKFAVFAGNRQTYSEQLDTSGNGCKSGTDHTYEQMFPTITLGNKYTALPFKNNKGGYFIKVLAIEDYTRVSMNGNYYRTLQQGEFFVWNVNIDTATRITADKRISVAQFSLGDICSQHPMPKVRFGGVVQLQLVPDHQFCKEANVSRLMKEWWGSSSSLLAHENYMNVLVKRTDTAQFRINGKAVPIALWKTSNSLDGYSYAMLDIDSGNYHLTSNKGFMAYVYGYGPIQSFAYEASSNFKPEYNDFFVNSLCVFDSSEFTAVNADSFYNYTWKLSNRSGTFSGKQIKLRFTDTGKIRVVMYSNHIRTNALDSVTKNISIRAAKSRYGLLLNDTIICGKLDLSIFPKNFTPDNKYTWSNGHPAFYFNTKLPGQLWQRVDERNGCFYIDTLNIENYEFPVPSFTTSDTVFCANRIKPITFINTSTSTDSLVLVNWDFGDQNINDTNKTVTHIYKKSNDYLVVLSLRTIHGCEAMAVQPIEIKATPEPNFNILSLDSCLVGNQYIFTNTTVIDSASHMRFKWYFSDSFVLSNNNPVGTYSYKLAGQQYAALIYENWNGCIDTMKKDIYIYQAPKPEFKFQTNFSCSNDSLHILNTTITNYKPLKTLWDFGDNKKDTAYSPAHLYMNKGTYNVKLVARIPQGCMDSLTQPVTIYGAPKADFKINDGVQCLVDNRFMLINTSSSDTGNFPLREWTYSDGGKDQNVDTVLKSFTSSGNKNVKLKVSGIFGCVDSITKMVQVKNSPTVEFDINQKSQCFNTQLFNFSYRPLIGNDTINGLTWYYYTDSIKNVSAVSNIKFPYLSSYLVKLKLISNAGCIGETQKTVFVNPNPKANFKIPKDLQCLNGNAFSMVHYSSITSGSSLAGFNWEYGDNTTSNSEFPPSKTYSKSGSYKVKLTVISDSGCIDSVSSFATVRASALITIDTIKQVCLHDTSQLNGSAFLANGFIRKYQWEFGDNSKTDTIANAAIKHLYDKVGSYTVKLTTISNYNCVDSKTITNWATVNALPNAAFGYTIKDGGQHNSVISFSDLTIPTSQKVYWNFGQYGTSKKKDTAVSIIDTTTIKAQLYVTDINGCTGMIEKNIFVSPPGEMYFPTAFTANGDGLNDGFGPVGIAFATNYKFTIYNRWGEMVFQSTKLGETWNGTYNGNMCQNGVYIYKLELNDFYGQYKSYEGSVLLLW